MGWRWKLMPAFSRLIGRIGIWRCKSSWPVNSHSRPYRASRRNAFTGVKQTRTSPLLLLGWERVTIVRGSCRLPCLQDGLLHRSLVVHLLGHDVLTWGRGGFPSVVVILLKFDKRTLRATLRALWLGGWSTRWSTRSSHHLWVSTFLIKMEGVQTRIGSMLPR